MTQHRLTSNTTKNRNSSTEIAKKNRKMEAKTKVNITCRRKQTWRTYI